MDSPDVVAALRAGAPDAAGQLYDAHAEDLYQYCWLVLRSRQKAQVAMRDAIILTGARITGLRDPSMLKAWLFAIARAECGRHRPGSAGESDEPVAPPQQPDAALRIMAWNSVISLIPDEREALDLVTRHGMTPPEVALVLGLPAPSAPALIAAARLHLEQALTAEILINRESQECAGRADALRGGTGTVTPAVRERLLRHAGSCPACLPRRPRNVSAARIFGLLPRPALTEGGWAGALRRLSDPEPPDADARALLDADILDTGDAGVPCPQDADVLDSPDGDVPGTEHAGGPGGASPRRRGRWVCAGVGAAVAAVGVAAALAAGSPGGHAAPSGAGHHLPAAANGPARARVGQPGPQPGSGPATPGATPRHARPASRAAAGAGQADDDPGQLTRDRPRCALRHRPGARTAERLGHHAPGRPGGPAWPARRPGSVAGAVRVREPGRVRPARGQPQPPRPRHGLLRPDRADGPAAAR